MTPRLRPVGLFIMVISAVLAGQGANAQQAEEIANLRCAAGFGCMTQCEALTVLGLENSENAKTLYASKHPAEYVRDVERLHGRAPEICGASTSGDESATNENDRESTGTDEEEQVSDNQSDKDSSCHFDENGLPINCAQGGSGGGSATPNEGAETNDYAQWEGYAEKPCPGGTLYNDPRHPLIPDMRMLACIKGEDGASNECGLTAANFACLTKGNLKALCYGVTTAQRAATMDAVCQTGNCPAFSFVVCQ